MKPILLAVVSLTVLASGRCWAAGVEGPSKPMQEPQGSSSGACQQDAARVCPDTQPGDGKFGPCMKEHIEELSPACKAKIATMKEKIKAKKEECKEEFAKACPDMKPGDGKFGPCIKEHKKDLSPACRRVAARMMHRGKRLEKGEGGQAAPDSQSAPAQPASGGDRKDEDGGASNNNNAE